MGQKTERQRAELRMRLNAKYVSRIKSAIHTYVSHLFPHELLYVGSPFDTPLDIFLEHDNMVVRCIACKKKKIEETKKLKAPDFMHIDLYIHGDLCVVNLSSANRAYYATYIGIMYARAYVREEQLCEGVKFAQEKGVSF